MNYPGQDRIAGFRNRLADMRRDTDGALEQTAALQTDVEALRSEVARLTVAIGTQIADLRQAVERLEAHLAEADAEVPGGVSGPAD